MCVCYIIHIGSDLFRCKYSFTVSYYVVDTRPKAAQWLQVQGSTPRPNWIFTLPYINLYIRFPVTKPSSSTSSQVSAAVANAQPKNLFSQLQKWLYSFILYCIHKHSTSDSILPLPIYVYSGDRAHGLCWSLVPAADAHRHRGLQWTLEQTVTGGWTLLFFGQASFQVQTPGMRRQQAIKSKTGVCRTTS